MQPLEIDMVTGHGARQHRRVEYLSAKLELRNPRDDSILPVIVPALADASLPFTQIPERVCRRLKLEVFECRDVRLTDGSFALYNYVGPIVAQFGNRSGYLGAIVRGDVVRLGKPAIDEMDLVVDVRDGTVDVHPERPLIARLRVGRAA